MSLSPKGFSTALKTLTVIPWPGREGRLASSLPWFPVIGLLLGLILYGLARLWGLLLPQDAWTGGAAMLLLAAGTGFTRCLHLDGLADWADSLGAMRTREKRLEIMKDSHIGSFGVIILILVLMARWTVFERILSSGSTIWILIIPVISRDMMVELITTLPYARSGPGMGKDFVEGASPRHRWISHGITLVFCVPFGPCGLLIWVVALLATRIFRRRCLKGFGGITGDLLGTANEMVEILLLALCSLAGKTILLYTGWGWITSA